MPEYLSPGVYVEEVELGPKPIEGVSTSTAGVVGVTERGPVDVPVLVTSFAEFGRVFGGYLDPRAYQGANADDLGATWYLPHAVEGFFQNGGQRLYVVRVASDGAEEAEVALMNRGDATGYRARLLVGAQQDDELLIVAAGAAPLVAGGGLLVDDGAATEYVTVGTALEIAAAVFGNRVRALRVPADTGHTAGAAVTELTQIDAPAGVDFSTTLAVATVAGTNQIRLTARPATPTPDLAAGDVLRIGDPAGASREYVVVERVPADPSDTTITLRRRLAFAHSGAAPAMSVGRVTNFTAGGATTLLQPLSLGDGVMLLADATLIPTPSVVRIGTGADAGYHLVSGITARELRGALDHDHPSGERVAVLSVADAGGDPATRRLLTAAPAGATTIDLVSRAGLAADNWIRIAGGNPEYAQIDELPATPATAVTLRQPLRLNHAADDPVALQSPPVATATTLLHHVNRGVATVLLADAPPAPPAGGAVLLDFGDATSPAREFRELGGAVTPSLIPLAEGVRGGHGPEVRLAARNEIFTVRALDVGEWGNELRVKVEDEDPALVETAVAVNAGAGSDVQLASISGVEPGSLVEILDFSTELTTHAAEGETAIQVANRAGLAPGDQLRLGRSDPEFVTVLDLPATTSLTSFPVRLAAPLRRAHALRGRVDRMEPSGLPRLAKVAAVDGYRVRFDGGLAFPVSAGWVVRSREFRLTVEQVKRGSANPRTPGLERMERSETHRYLSLDSRHSRYIGKIIGATINPVRLWDRRPEGESDLVRVVDPRFTALDQDTTQEVNRLGPDLIYETLPGGRRRSVGRWLEDGENDDTGVDDTTYRGQDNVDPLQRTGLFSLKNEEAISLVAIPGRVSDFLQGEVINHCELLRYRFALLDSVPGDRTGARLPEVTAQRQQFDTKYAALYYPWLLLRDPFPTNPAQPGVVALPPSGHMMGIYARSDVTRGVHKAPGNEVIAGITGLQRVITKGEHDILNPSPVNVNVLRDFREQRRGLRVWGARVITSDFEWKYVNVRRLFIFVERSLELGTQWVVFEPNDEHLWARVRRSISDFLTVVWRNGGLMGTKADEAFFVKCDRTTMTQLDIDSGRLIVVVGIAPVKPAEFVIIRIGQWTGGTSLEEV